MKVRVETIIRIVAERYDIPIDVFVSQKRTKDIARPRMMAVFLARALTSWSLPALGRFFGNRDHTTILHAIRRINQLAKVPEFKERLEELRFEIVKAAEIESKVDTSWLVREMSAEEKAIWKANPEKQLRPLRKKLRPKLKAKPSKPGPFRKITHEYLVG